MRPTALSLTPDQAFLWVADGMNGYTWSFQIAPDGALINGEPFQRLELPEETLFSGVEGLAVDTVGYLWRPAPWAYKCASSRDAARKF